MSGKSKPQTLTIISGKGGTGKTSLAASFAVLSAPVVMADCDVDAANLHLVLSPETKSHHDFHAMPLAKINQERCSGCGTCYELCRYEAIGRTEGAPSRYVIDPLACEACLVCKEFCPEEAIFTVDRPAGEWFVSSARTGPMVHARLGIAQENSGKLVTEVRKAASEAALEQGIDRIIVDGPPGTGCAVIASLTGSDRVLAVTEATMSGLSDLAREQELAAHFDIPLSVVINKADLNEEITQKIRQWARDIGTPIIGELPYDQTVTRAMLESKAVVEYGESEIGAAIKKIWERVSSGN